jgi:hypothetical protein
VARIKASADDNPRKILSNYSAERISPHSKLWNKRHIACHHSNLCTQCELDLHNRSLPRPRQEQAAARVSYPRVCQPIAETYPASLSTAAIYFEVQYTQL